MKKILVTCYLLLPTANCLLPTANCQRKLALTQYVNPFIGTGGHGHTFPGPTMPFGACQVGPDTRLDGWDGCSGYHYSDSVIYGFSHTHLSGTGCSDYGDILLMPVTKEMQLDKYQYASRFSHGKEKAAASFYRVYLEDPGIKVELTATLHGAMHRYTYRAGDQQYVVLDLKHRDEVLDSKMEKVDDYTIRGYRFSKAWAKNQKVFYEITFSKPIESIQYEPVLKGTNTTAIHLERSLHCIIKFQSSDLTRQPTNADAPGQHPDQKRRDPLTQQLIVQCAISGVDEEGAHKNLVAEMKDFEFDKYKVFAENEWDQELSKIQITQFANGSMSQDEKSRNSEIEKLTIFYTALYHSMIHPSIYNDVDGRYRGRDDKIHNTEGKFNYYTVFSLWDTYRGLHPLLTILDKKRTNDFINTFIKQYEQGGRLPIWELSSNETNCMIGYHVVSVIWDAYNKGIRDFDANKAYEAMTRIATHFDDYEGEGLDMKLKESAKKGAADADALESYCKYGYVRSDDSHESVSKTLEYAYDDWCIARMALALNKKEDFEYYQNRSSNWMNVFDPTTGFMRARRNGGLYEPFSPYTVDNNYTEANAWQYSFYVPQNIGTLIQMMQGWKGFEKRLDSLFNANEKTAGREQADITGLIGQYAHGNEPSHHIAYLYDYFAHTKSDSIVSSILDSLYRNAPDGLSGNEDCGQMSAWYILSSLGIYPVCPGQESMKSKPHFGSIKVTNDIGKSFYINYKDDVDRISSAYNNLIDVPSELPSVPYIESASKRTFKDSALVGFGSYELLNDKRNINRNQKVNYKIIYSLLSDDTKREFKKPFYIFSDETVYFYAENDYGSTAVQTASFSRIAGGRKIILHNQYNPSYSAGGSDALMDGIYGKLNWRAGDWQGYQGQDIEVVMALDKPLKINSIAASFLEDQNSWIFYPKEVSFYVSNDSVKWTLVKTIPTNKSDHEEKVSISKFQTSDINQQPSKFVKLIAKNFGPMPQWHEGRGNPTFIFIDEFEVK